MQFTNVLVGDVWLCGGQSNMELPLNRTRDGTAVKERQFNGERLWIQTLAAYVGLQMVRDATTRT